MEIYLQPEPYEIQCIKFRYRYSPGIHTPPFHKRCHQGSHKLPAEVILKNAPRMFQSTASNHNQAHNHGKQSLSTVEEANWKIVGKYFQFEADCKKIFRVALFYNALLTEYKKEHYDKKVTQK
jgi:hypothetical protein